MGLIACLVALAAVAEFGWHSPLGFVPSAFATRLPADLSKTAEKQFDNSKIRLDGSVELADGQLYLPLLPPATKKPSGKGDVESTYPPDRKRPDIVFYANGWAHVRLFRRGDACTVALAADLPEKLKKRIEALKFPSDLIVPNGFVLAKSYRNLIQDVPTISLLDDAAVHSADFGMPRQAASREHYKGNGTVFLTSITAGSITMLDGKTLAKIAEFPTEGTPCSIELVGNHVYITDQGKSRILIVDPVARKFKGQIDLPAHCAPKGIVALPNGKWIYVSESAVSKVAVIETATGKTLVQTKTHPGPGRMAVTPDGTFVVVLNVTSGEVSIMSTYNQQVVATIRVGDMPTAIVIGHDGKYAYVSNRISNTVSVIDISGHRVLNTLKTCQYPTGIAMSKDGSKLYVASARENNVTAYDTKTLEKLTEAHTPPECEFPGCLCPLPDGKHLLLCSQQSDALAVLDMESMKFEKPLTFGHANHEAAWEPVP